MNRSLTPSQERYLEWINRLGEAGPVRVKDLAAKLGVRLPTVSRAVKELKAAGLVLHETYGRVELTPAGRDASEAIVRRSWVLRRLLVEVLGVDAEAADLDSRRLAPHVGDPVLERLETLTDFAVSSEAWIRRLQHRIRTRPPITR